MKTNKPLRIAFITNNYTPYHGGVVQSIDATVHELQRLGHDVRLITLDFLGNTKDDPSYVYRIPCPIRFRWGASWVAIPWRRTHHIKNYLRSFNPDIVHLHHPFLLGQTGHNVARAMGIPTVFTYHSIYRAYTHYIPLPPFLTRFLIRRIVPPFCNRVDRVIVPSAAIQKFLYATEVHTPSKIIPSPVRTPFFADEQTVEPHHNPLHLLYVGRFAKEKNIPFILDALAKLDPKCSSQCNFVGYGPEYESLQSYAYDTLQLSPDKIRFTCNPPLDKLIEIYRDADLFLFPSTSDTQALVLSEAMATGTPVIAIPGPGQTDIIRHGFNGFFSDTPAEMAHHITHLDADRQLLATLAGNAINTAQRYHPSVTVGKLLELYHELLGG